MPSMKQLVQTKKFKWGMISALIAGLGLLLAFCNSIKAVPVMKGEFDGHVEDFDEFKVDNKDYQREQRQVNREVLRGLKVPEARIREIEDGEAE